ncbi:MULTISPECIES: division/cell wall cluster transcriptional repressor MraZ [unclassified Haematospirillum]|uniref:division/cell wall cluster transcriptional repressor MraZ n=1 Tax=unclassified Haematospirillum TaxID=2622088 RepID=UPI001438F899|nr:MULTISPECIES: division/cell wall cluster transcriptional repressor MraZ [unclassified Haematospirillum]NKD54794.1 division/cell wall cluster transcriptional repressor MraZ [Haematospirillum sp. H4890]NKD74632.1 division/cell wall cluster transcriptional repressor MraZ [Haematospirillum sp. H4485]NKD87482.1 division/cell wall cluster transcriptional repressor MraZ [Haematospirillum sp. 15-248]
MSLFVSTIINKIDRKGRVSVPALWRSSLTGQGFAGVVCYPSFTTSCLDGMGMDRLEKIASSLDRLDIFSPEQDEMAQLVFASARQLAFDTEGRIMVPEDLLEHAGLSSEAAFVGRGRTFQIWEPSALKKAEAEIRRRAAERRPSLHLGSGD